MNSDADMIRLFLKWLALVGVGPERLRFRVSIHESADEPSAVGFWKEVVAASSTSFDRSNLKRHTPRTVRKNVGEDYHGCLCITVGRSAELIYESPAGSRPSQQRVSSVVIRGWCNR